VLLIRTQPRLGRRITLRRSVGNKTANAKIGIPESLSVSPHSPWRSILGGLGRIIAKEENFAAIAPRVVSRWSVASGAPAVRRASLESPINRAGCQRSRSLYSGRPCHPSGAAGSPGQPRRSGANRAAPRLRLTRSRCLKGDVINTVLPANF